MCFTSSRIFFLYYTTHTSINRYLSRIRLFKVNLNICREIQNSDMKIIQMYLFYKTYVQHFDDMFLQELCIRIKVDMQS